MAAMDHTADAVETMSAPGVPDRFELVVPGRPRSLAPLRVFVAAVAADAGCSVDEIDDLRLGVSEAFSLMIDVVDPAGAPDSVTIVVSIDGRMIRLALSSTPPVSYPAPDALAAAVLSSVVDRHVVDGTTVLLEKLARETLGIDET
jgi:hypothetical protein